MPTEAEIRDGHLQALQSRDDEIARLRSALEEILKDGPIWRAQRIAREALANEQATE